MPSFEPQSTHKDDSSSSYKKQSRNLQQRDSRSIKKFPSTSVLIRLARQLRMDYKSVIAAVCDREVCAGIVLGPLVLAASNPDKRITQCELSASGHVYSSYRFCDDEVSLTTLHVKQHIPPSCPSVPLIMDLWQYKIARLSIAAPVVIWWGALWFRSLSECTDRPWVSQVCLQISFLSHSWLLE